MTSSALSRVGLDLRVQPDQRRLDLRPRAAPRRCDAAARCPARTGQSIDFTRSRTKSRTELASLNWAISCLRRSRYQQTTTSSGITFCTPCCSSFAVIHRTRSSEAKAFSSTRWVARNLISSSVAPLSAQTVAHALGALAILHRFAFEAPLLDVGETKPEVDHLDLVREGVATGVALERPQDGEPALVEVVQHEQRELVASADLVDQAPRGGDRDAFRAHDRQVVALGEPHRLEQLVEAFFLAEQQRPVATARTGRLDRRHRCGRVRPTRVAEDSQVAFHLDRAEREARAGVRLDQVAARVEHDFPARGQLGVLRHEVRQQRLGEVLDHRATCRSGPGSCRAPRTSPAGPSPAACRSRSPSCTPPASRRRRPP